MKQKNGKKNTHDEKVESSRAKEQYHVGKRGERLVAFWKKSKTIKVNSL